MIIHRFIPTLISILMFGLITYLFTSCSENKTKESSSSKDIKQISQKYDRVTIEVNISNENWLSILLANDGTINRKGNRIFDVKDKNFFMGLTTSKPFDSLMSEIPSALFEYCGSPSP